MKPAFQPSSFVGIALSTPSHSRTSHPISARLSHPNHPPPSNNSPLRNLLLAAAATAFSVVSPAPQPASATINLSTQPPQSIHHIAHIPTHNSQPVLKVLHPKSRPTAATLHRKTPVLAAAVQPAAPRPSLPDVISFWWGEYLMWNPGAKVVSLLATTLLCMYLGSFLYRFADPAQKEASSPFWHSVRAIANPLEDDWQLPALRTTSIVLASIGMVVFAILVGMVTESVESAVHSADGETSTVVVRDHILICGWSNHVSHMLRDMSRLGSNVKVVVMANPDDKADMLKEIRNALSSAERKRLRVFYRPGAPIMSEDLRRVAAESARKIILVNTRRGDLIDADRTIISRALALRQNLPAFQGDIVAELNNSRDEGILQSILSSTNARSVETVNAEQLLFRFMAQAIRQPGLADVVARLLGSNSSTTFHVEKVKDIAPQLAGMNYSDVRPTSIPGCILCGFFDEDGKVRIESGQAMSKDGAVLKADTEVLILGSGQKSGLVENNEVKLNSTEVSNAVHSMRSLSHGKGAESYLFCGWRPDMADMLRELDTVLSHGSKVTILDNDVPESLDLKLRNISVQCVTERADRYESLEKLLSPKAKRFDHVVLIGSALGKETELKAVMGHEEDTKTLASLVYVNELLEKQAEAGSKKDLNKLPLVTIEFINEGVANIVKGQGNIANVILPQDLGAKIAAQTVRDNRLNGVWNELLSQRGREVYLRSCESYIGQEEESSFAQIADRVAGEKNELIIGYVDADGKVVINPQANRRFGRRQWDAKEAFIVLSED